MTINVRRHDFDNLAFALERYYDDRRDEANISCLAGYARVLIDGARQDDR